MSNCTYTHDWLDVSDWRFSYITSYKCKNCPATVSIDISRRRG